MKAMNDNNLIFLISQPRAGSTLIQRMLGSHPEIHTTSEPWVMLHPLYAMKKTGIETEYSSDLALEGLADFLSQIKDGDAVYREKISQMYKALYGQVLGPTGKKYYLDKTPRYYFIINELFEIYPGAKFIILFRNPLAVLLSIVESWTKTEWYKLSEYKHDLLHAPDCLLQGLKILGHAALSLQYENLLMTPESEVKKLCEFIGVKFDKKIIEYNPGSLPRWQHGDQKTVYEKTKPDNVYSDKWMQSLNNPQSWRVAREYLDYLGKDRIDEMGYSFGELDAVLTKNKPAVNIDKHSVSLFTLLDNTRDALWERKQLQEQLRHREEQIRLKNEQIRQREEQVQQQLNNKDKIIQQQIQWREQQLKNKNAVIEQKNQQLEELEQRLKNKDTEIRQKENVVETKNAELREKDKLIEIKDVQLRQKDMIIASKDELLKQKDQFMESTNVQLRHEKHRVQELLNSYSFRLARMIILPCSILRKLFLKPKR